MPSGRKKVPFSAKQKKKQLQVKRERKQNDFPSISQLLSNNITNDDEESKNDDDSKLRELTEPLSATGSSTRYQLKFHTGRQSNPRSRKSPVIIPEEPITLLSKSELELPPPENGLESLGIPIRPAWNYQMTKQKLDMQENKFFREYVNEIERLEDFDQIGLFELNLETWRQMWRVMEMSDILLLITDIRHPTAQFPPALYQRATQTLNKSIILILNKVDLVPPSVAVAWKHHFQEKYPSMEVVFFCSLPRRVKNKAFNEDYQLKRALVVKNLKSLFDACKREVNGKVDLSSWEKKMDYDMLNFDEDSEKPQSQTCNEIEEESLPISEFQKFKDGILTIGCVGYPNVGKSSLLNTLMGHKVVSVSRTPGHTKYFQTIFLTPKVKLCDCPGLVFPSYISKSLQVLTGSCPISQLSNPYPAIEFLAQRLNLPEALKLVMDGNKDEDMKILSAYSICKAWAEKKRFYTAKAARPDFYRAANNILRFAVSGPICLFFYPPGYFDNEESWKICSDIQELTDFTSNQNHGACSSIESSDEEDVDEPSSSSRSQKSNIFMYLQSEDPDVCI